MNHVYLYRIMIFRRKKLGSVRTLFLLAVSIYAASKTEFTNNSLKLPKIVKLNIDTLIIAQGLSIYEKNQSSCYCPFKGPVSEKPVTVNVV